MADTINEEKVVVETNGEVVKFLGRFKSFITQPYFIFLLKKLVFYAIVIFVSVTLIFIIPRYMPGDPATRILPGKQSHETVEAYNTRINAFREYYGLNKPINIQYRDFWISLLHGDLGPSFSHPGTSTGEILGVAMGFTFAIVIPVVLLSFFIGNWIGAKSAHSKTKTSKLIYYTSLFAQSIPFYWLALIFFWFFVFKHGYFDYGYAPAGTQFALTPSYMLIVLKYYILPFITLLIGFTGGWATGMRSMTLYELESSYLLYAEQLGFKMKSIRKYAQRNAILPQITGLNLRMSDAVGATLVLEWVFGWPGVGDILLKSATSQDFPLLMASSIVVITIVIIGNFIIDILYGFIDPRIRTGARS